MTEDQEFKLKCLTHIYHSIKGYFEKIDIDISEEALELFASYHMSMMLSVIGDEAIFLEEDGELNEREEKGANTEIH